MQKSQRFFSTKGFNAQVLVGRALQYWGTGSNNMEAFSAVTVDGTFSFFNADTNVSLGPNAPVAAGTRIYAAVVRGGSVHRSTPFSLTTHKVNKTPYSAPQFAVKKVVTAGTVAAGKEYGLVLRNTTTQNVVENEVLRYSYVAKAGDTLVNVANALIAKINDKTSPANSATDLFVTASLVETDNILLTANFVGVTFSVGLFSDAYADFSVTTVAAAKWGQGTPDQVLQLEAEGLIFDGVTANYPRNGGLPEEFGKPASLVIPTGQYVVYQIDGFVTKAGKGPINQEQDFQSIILALDSNANDANPATDNVDIVFGFSEPV